MQDNFILFFRTAFIDFSIMDWYNKNSLITCVHTERKIMPVYDNISSLVGGTPIVRLSSLERNCNSYASLFGKLESFNPASSAKDRVALKIIDTAEKQGLLKPGGVIIEPTSGNTGIGLAAIGASRGYRVIIVMPDSMSIERVRLMHAYGAQTVLTPGALGMKGAIEKAEELSKSIPDSIIAGQFENPANPEAHYKTTGPEIWKDMNGKIDVFVAGIGTGGTVSGSGRFLKEQNPQIEIVGVEPASSPLLTQGKSGAHKIQGIGANFIPKNLDRSILDQVLTVANEDAMHYARLMAQKEGLLVGISSGAALAAAISLAINKDYAGKNIVVLLPDTGEHYLSTDLFEEGVHS